MGVPFYKNWFSFSIRRNRKSFIHADLSIFLIVTIMGMLVYLFPGLKAEGHFVTWSVFSIVASVLSVASYALISQRFRDMNMSGWFALIFIPVNAFDAYFHLPITLILLLILWVIPGTKGINRFGNDPLERG